LPSGALLSTPSSTALRSEQPKKPKWLYKFENFNWFENTRFPRIKYGVGLVNPGMTIKGKFPGS
jgi:hypothetical protein